MFRQRTLLALTVIGIVPFFIVITRVVNAARTRRQDLAIEWATRGQRDLAAGRATAAADDFRTAQQYARDKNQYRLQLAEALVAASRPLEARSQLLTLWAEAPGNGVVNLELARLAARDNDVSDALRYYHGAIDGAWDRDAVIARRNARFELSRFLIARNANTQAQAELIALAGGLPPDPALMTETGALLLTAGADTRAITVLQNALALDSHNARAARLAGEASFNLGDYRGARRLLGDAQRASALDAQSSAMLDTATRVLALDPGTRGISSRERLRRVVRAYEVAASALERCPSDTLDGLRQQMDALKPGISERKLARDPDAVDAAIALSGRVETAVVAACGHGAGDERALELIMRQRRSAS